MTIAFELLILAAILGGLLVMSLPFRDDAAEPTDNAWYGWLIGGLHGIFGAAGLVALLLALRHAHGLAAHGAGGFGIGAAIVLALALLIGLSMLALGITGRRTPFLLIGIHIMVAIIGITLVTAIVALR